MQGWSPNPESRASPPLVQVDGWSVLPGHTNDPTHQLLEEHLHRIRFTNMNVAKRLQHICDRQGAFLNSQVSWSSQFQETQHGLQSEHRELKAIIEQHLGLLNGAKEERILCQEHLRTVEALRNDMELQKKQLELYVQELESMGTAKVRQVFALVVVDDSVPEVIKKNDVFTVTIKLLFGSANRHHLLNTSPLSLAGSLKKLSIPHNFQLSNSFEGRIAVKAIAGSTMKPISTKFNIQVTVKNPNGDSSSLTLQSNTSKPFIIISNEVQFKKGVGKLIKKSFPSNSSHISWYHFCNVLNLYFPSATRQKSVLTTFHLQYLWETFFNCQQQITTADFNEFWEKYFSACLHTLRYTRRPPVSSFFQDGIIWFISKDHATNILRSIPPPSEKYFTIRFSESNPGGFSIVYNDFGGQIRHYLLKSGEILPNLIMEQPHFETLLLRQTALENDFYSCSFTIAHKDIVLKDHLLKTTTFKDPTKATVYSDLP
eukprot:TRINITY_DN2933_c0_g2_i1.p1 TRINITY_DN2933_c0_g2~~TRINITY_DN2933_c0_g2_i1.p1  ORF type:complete len:486 (+),score=69.25 TRINITY_DN2933_c0_g2_i1:117-1574(+)